LLDSTTKQTYTCNENSPEILIKIVKKKDHTRQHLRQKGQWQGLFRLRQEYEEQTYRNESHEVSVNQNKSTSDGCQ